MATLKEKLDNFAKQHDAALDADTRDDSRFPASARETLIDRMHAEQMLIQTEASIRSCMAMERIEAFLVNALTPGRPGQPGKLITTPCGSTLKGGLQS